MPQKAAREATVDVDQSRLVVVDVGAAEGLQPKWAAHPHAILPVLFEPNPEEAAKVRNSLRDIPGALVIESGLSYRAGAQTLTIGRWYGCTSLLRADPEVLRGYAIAHLYDPVGTATVTCERYDALHQAGRVPAPDVIKLDVEGYEYEVLEGFGDLLGNCLGVETEAWFTPVYRDTKLMHRLVEQLGAFGLVLRRIEPIDAFDGDLVVCNAFFTMNQERAGRLEGEQRRKFALMSEVWELRRPEGQT